MKARHPDEGAGTQAEHGTAEAAAAADDAAGIAPATSGDPRLDGVLVDVNDKFCEMLGYPRAELRGKSIRDITHPDDYGTGAAFRQRIA